MGNPARPRERASYQRNDRGWRVTTLAPFEIESVGLGYVSHLT